MLLDEIRDGIAAVTDNDIRRAQRHLDPAKDKERVLGTVHSEEARRIYAYSGEIEMQSEELALKARRASSDEEAAHIRGQATRLHDLAHLAKCMFWLAAQDSLGDAAWDLREDVGIREGWILVAVPESAHPLGSLFKNLGREL